MRSPLVQLLTARRFAPLFVTQFLGAFNDNLLKSAMGIVVTFRLAEQSGLDSASLVMLAGAVFIAPFFLFSGASGTLADRIDKSLIARLVKLAEIAIMTLGAVGLWRESVPLLFAALFCLGTHSTVFGPIKYALLPQHLRDDELVAGNALIEAGTFLAILFGTILGGSVVLLAKGSLIVGGFGVVCAVLGWLAARQIPPAPPSATDAPRPRLLADSVAVVGHVTSRPALLLPILAVSWFWLFGATVVSGLPAFAKDVLVANEQVVTMMLALFAVGVGLGSILAERLLHGEVSARFVPVAAAAMAFFAWDLHAASVGRPAVAELATVSVFLRSPGKLEDCRGSRWRGDGGRSLHGAALRDPAARKRAGAPRARDRGQQHRQRPGDGDRCGCRRPASRTRLDDGRALRAVRTADHPCRARGGVDPAADDGEEPLALDPQTPLSRARGGARARAGGAAEGRSSPPITRRFSMACCSGHSCPAIRSLPSTRRSRSSGGRSRSSSLSTRCRSIRRTRCPSAR